MKTEELRKKDIPGLEKSVRELQKKLNEMRFAFSANQPKNSKEVNGARKDIARMLTIINEKKNHG